MKIEQVHHFSLLFWQALDLLIESSQSAGRIVIGRSARCLHGDTCEQVPSRAVELLGPVQKQPANPLRGKAKEITCRGRLYLSEDLIHPQSCLVGHIGGLQCGGSRLQAWKALVQDDRCEAPETFVRTANQLVAGYRITSRQSSKESS